ncbi:2Fe-2S iron-sulfur cluster-binding protein, partial [Alterinioella nitratireducens]|uniref:2Fe-2S iron-sulfur cluster-binding protein n=1 Tax=Alterinioella nitratireducens TaxID=2735915 RepID=UPI0040594520
MSTRLASGGRLIDRHTTRTFTFNGKRLSGHDGDTLASALLANGQTLMGRSFKYHRPRGVVASGAEEPNALMGIGEGGRFEPNQRATTTEIFDGLTAKTQNHWPSLDFDVGAVNAMVPRLLPAGFYYKTFMFPRPFWKHVFEPVIRKSAGLGAAPKDRDADRYEHFYAHVDLLVAGGGIAGLQAALRAGQAGLRVLLVEQTAHWGGRAPVDGVEIGGKPAEEWINDTLQVLEGTENVRIRTRSMASGVYDHGYALVYERLTDHAPEMGGPRHRLWRVRAGQ